MEIIFVILKMILFHNDALNGSKETLFFSICNVTIYLLFLFSVFFTLYSSQNRMKENTENHHSNNAF